MVLGGWKRSGNNIRGGEEGCGTRGIREEKRKNGSEWWNEKIKSFFWYRGGWKEMRIWSIG